jgi:hypothetical protein
MWHFTFSRRRVWRWQAFWDIALCNLVEIDRRFRDTYCLYHQGCQSRNNFFPAPIHDHAGSAIILENNRSNDKTPIVMDIKKVLGRTNSPTFLTLYNNVLFTLLKYRKLHALVSMIKSPTIAVPKHWSNYKFIRRLSLLHLTSFLRPFYSTSFLRFKPILY